MDNNDICEYSGLPSTQSYITNPQAKGVGVGGKSIKENFIDSSPISLEGSPNSEVTGSNSSEFMYNWIRKHSGK